MRARRSGKCTAALTGTLGLALAVAACGPKPHDDAASTRHTPVQVADAPARLPVPHGKGSRTPVDFNGDGHRDLVLNDLVKAQEHADDAGIGIVYGGERGLTPGARQLLSPRRQAAPTKGRLPAVFDAEATCDLDGDGFTDLVVSTDPPYDGQGQPPVPLQILYGSPSGLTGKAVKLTIPARARVGNDWPDQPVCGDFDGDDAQDLVVHASGGRLSFLRGPFTRKGSPRAAPAPI
ncbi:FG-GAP repeat domain-containing protein, partial [Streptomyces muensis]